MGKDLAGGAVCTPYPGKSPEFCFSTTNRKIYYKEYADNFLPASYRFHKSGCAINGKDTSRGACAFAGALVGSAVTAVAMDNSNDLGTVAGGAAIGAGLAYLACGNQGPVDSDGDGVTVSMTTTMNAQEPLPVSRLMIVDVLNRGKP